MKMKLSAAAVEVVRTLADNHFEAYIVGGAVRDALLGRESKDWDITTNATPEQMLPLFTESFYDNAFGTVMIAGKHLKAQFNLAPDTCDDDDIFDITTYRSEQGYSDKRRPDSVTWGASVEEDLKRRDFTINAIAFRIPEPRIPNPESEYDVELVDPYEGQKDIEQKIIRAVGNPTERFQEDALRIMRAVRIAAQLGFTIEDSTLAAIRATAPNLAEISKERIGGEMMKILSSDHAADSIILMGNTGILDIIIPEFMLTKGVKQAGHHIYDVFMHSVEALRACPSPDPIVRLATLLHDIDKPTVMAQAGPRGVTFHNHEVVGARTAKKIADRLRLPKRDQDRIFTLVRWHMFAYDSKMTDAAIRRFIRRVGKENIHDMMALRVGDRVGGGSKATSWRLTELQKRIGEQFYEPLSLKDLAIDGSDVMKILDIPPSRKVGEILTTLFEEIIDDSSKNTKEYLEQRVKELA
jgi:tRNA nucleotidyltransferase/poly(A) polymerase